MVFLKLAGNVQFIQSEHLLVINCDAAQLPRLYSDVVDRRQKPVGKLVEIYGNIKKPYASVSCRSTKNRIAGEKLYTK
ncbi:H/ACA ribonucleoprotein complex subunit GAR1 [Methanoplanus endosymbiosus]|uniref:RNA-binding protein n=1 Tax=Methanoplanus endosymbiosus TaxID=33865 RepID=A0A9E7PN69_9EURY|nr:RNA-binding protein [Methanoplanus endosymbiosus]UUX93363.1 RNA-binding protein [Methanoplanus endosymbiosus]